MEDNDEAQMHCEELKELLNEHLIADDDADILKELEQIDEEHALEYNTIHYIFQNKYLRTLKRRMANFFGDQ